MNKLERIKWIKVGDKLHEIMKQNPEKAIVECLVEAEKEVKKEMEKENAKVC